MNRCASDNSKETSAGRFPERVSRTNNDALRGNLGESRSGVCDIGAVEFQSDKEKGRDKNKHRSNQDDRHDGDHHGSNNDYR